jgi:hypothetical protein
MRVALMVATTTAIIPAALMVATATAIIPAAITVPAMVIATGTVPHAPAKAEHE